ncbi:hypothetical protein ANRL3_02417 [Anaerolineae bacterium]|nr:hypothetical protein ANRL3_02417 [Anaerolineae bacterium]
MSSVKPSEDTLRKVIEMEWLDHFQTRAQTWKGLEITAILAVALVGVDWRVGDPVVTIGAAILLLIVAQFGIQITIKHRTVEKRAFRVIIEYMKELGITNPDFKEPELLNWLDIFRFRKSPTSLFIMRLYFVIQLFALGYLTIRLLKS